LLDESYCFETVNKLETNSICLIRNCNIKIRNTYRLLAQVKIESFLK